MRGISLVVVVAAFKASESNFVESFEFLDTSKWVQSKDSRYSGQQWKEEGGGIETVVPHKFYGMTHVLDEPVAIGEEDFVMQYEVMFSKGVTCSGSYVKLLVHDPAFKADGLVESSPYSIMFGPDNCGSTKKVHLIFRQENPVTGIWEEKHMKTAVASPGDSESHLFTLIVKKDNTFQVLVDNESKASGSLLDDSSFEPSFQTPKDISDPADTKPSDWVDESKIPDPEATKPEDWDENAPKTIPDPAAVKPSGWMDDEPLEIGDPAASQPDDWDEEDDGEWEAPLVNNPLCSVGCGEWNAALIPNPSFKGKWSSPLFDNPAYKGEWAARIIANPGYFEEANPVSTIKSIGAIAIEILANDKGIRFDNFLIGNDVASALHFADHDFIPGREAAKKEARDSKMRERRQDRLREYEIGGPIGKMNYVLEEVYDTLIQQYDNEPIMTAGAALIGLLGLFFMVGRCLFGGSGAAIASDVAHKKDDDVIEKLNAELDEEEDEEEEEEEEDTKSEVKRRIPKK